MERILGDVATRLLHENERVRIWEMDLGPGARSATHRHDLDYVLVQIEGDRIAAEPEPDTGGTYRDYIEADVVPVRGDPGRAEMNRCRSTARPSVGERAQT